MTPIERGILEKAADNIGGSFGEVKEPLGSVQPLTTDADSLAEAGKFLMIGYLIGVLMTIRDTHVEWNPVTYSDYAELLKIIRQREDRIARRLD